MTNKPIILYGFKTSGHSHRAELMLSLLNLPFEFRAVDLAGGEHKREPFLKLNPFGQVPAIDDNGTIVADSTAILVYLAKRYDASDSWLPSDPVAAADIQRWLSLAQGHVFNGPCSARLAAVFHARVDHARAIEIAEKMLATLQEELSCRPFASGNRPTIGDVALYTYIAHAPEGGITLEPYPAIRSWLKRIELLPGFVAMPASKAGLLAA